MTFFNPAMLRHARYNFIAQCILDFVRTNFLQNYDMRHQAQDIGVIIIIMPLIRSKNSVYNLVIGI